MKKELKIDLGIVKADLRKRWPWKDDSVEEVSATNVVQYFNATDRIHFANELWRVMKKGAKAQIITPHWACNRAYSDLAFQWPPVVEQWYFHLNEKWRQQANPKEKRYRCNFEPTLAYGVHPMIQSRNQEYQQHAISFFKEAAQDLIATLTKL